MKRFVGRISQDFFYSSMFNITISKNGRVYIKPSRLASLDVPYNFFSNLFGLVITNERYCFDRMINYIWKDT